MGQAQQHDVARPVAAPASRAEQSHAPGRHTQVETGDPAASSGRRRGGSVFGGGVPWGANNGKPSGKPMEHGRVESPLGKEVAHAGHQAGHAIHKSTMRPGGIAEQGFTGTARPVPFREEMEQSFGADFSRVKVYADANAKQATEKLGASAYVMGDKIAFNTSSPDRNTVAHELTHVLQHTGRGGARPTSGERDSRGLDMAGEHEAENVESALASGKDAKTALSGAAPSSSVPRKKGPARKAAGGGFSAALTFDPDSFKNNLSYQLWGAPCEVPLPVPGLFASATPSVSITCTQGVNWDAAEESDKGLEVGVSVSGGVSLKLSLGSSYLNVASLYGELEATATGSFTYKLGKDAWSLAGDIALASDFAVGLSLGMGLIDYKFQFGHLDLAKLASIRFAPGSFSAGTLEWGADTKAAFGVVQAALDQGSQLAASGITKATEGAKYVYREFNSAADWSGDAFNTAVGGVGAVVNTVTDAAGDAVGAVTGAVGGAIDKIGWP